MAPCKICGIDKLSNEYPPTTVSEDCHHPPLVCLRCVVESCRKQQKCPQPGCAVKVYMNSPTIQWFLAILDEMFTEYETEYTPPVTVPSGNTVLNITVLNGDAAQIPYRPAMPLTEVKKHIEGKLNIPCNKQKLLYKDKEVLVYKDGGHSMTLAENNIPANATVYLVVLLLAIPEAFDHVVFDLYWGYPYSGPDYLDASCLAFNGKHFIGVADWCHRSSLHGIKHSGDVMNDHTRTGHHTIHVYLKQLPSNITHLFFTLSAWRSPNISRYPNPSLKFYEASNTNKDLCKTTFQHAGNSQAVIMCSVSRNVQGRWEIYESGKLSAGNAARYDNLITTIRGLILQGF